MVEVHSITWLPGSSSSAFMEHVMQLTYQGAFFSACVHESGEATVISMWNFREAGPVGRILPGGYLARGRSCRRASKWGAGSWIRPSTACLSKAGPFASNQK